MMVQKTLRSITNYNLRRVLVRHCHLGLVKSASVSVGVVRLEWFLRVAHVKLRPHLVDVAAKVRL